MKTPCLFLAAVAAGSLVAPVAHAEGAKHTRHTHKKPIAPAKSDAALKSEVEALRAEVAALRDELQAQRATGTTTQTQVATLQTKADSAAQAATSAAARADTALARADAVQAAETKGEARTDAKLKLASWAGDTRIGGTVFFNYSNINQQSNGVKQNANGTGFNVKRVYISIDHKFSDVWSANITTDVSNVIGETANNNYQTPAANTATGALSSIGEVGKGLYLKNAFVQAKLSPALIFRAGSAGTAWIPYIEAQNGHRYVEQLLIDEYRYGNSADWGLYALGDLAGGLISYQFGVVNGAGFRNDRVTKSVDLDGRISAQYKGFWAAVGGYSGRLGNDVQSPAGSLFTHTAQRIDVGLGYRNTLFNLGGEYLHATEFNSVTSTTQHDRANGFSFFGNVNITPKWQVFGRYDWIHPITISNATAVETSVSNHYFNVGLQWEPVKIIDLSLVYKRDSLTNLGTAAGTLAWQNGTGTIGGTTNGSYDEVGVFGQLKF